MANLTKRIIDLQTTSTLGSDDYVMVDGATNGTKKYLLKDVLDEIEDIKEGTALATGAVTTDKLAAGAVTNAKIGDGAVDTTNIADDAITAAKIDDGAVGTNALAAGAVTGAKIATGAVGTGNIASGAVTLDKIASDSNATSSRNGLMSSADKAKLDGFSAASNYALKSDIVGAYIFKGSVNTENDLPSTGLTVGDVYNIIAASSYGESGANVAWTGTAWDALGESFDISDGAIDTEQLANDAVTNDKLAEEAMTTVSPMVYMDTDPTYGSEIRQGYSVTFGNSDETVLFPSVGSDFLIDVANIPTLPEKKIGSGAITANKIAAGAVSTEKLTNSAVNTDKLATGAVSTDKIASLAVTTNKIAAGAVDNSKLANNAVGTAQIANGAVTSEKLGSDVASVINSKAAASDVTALSARVDAKADQEYVDEELEYKADIDGYYSQLTAGLAENLIGRGDAVPAEYLYRTAGGTADIEDGIATIDCIKGNTLVWNQMSNPSGYTTNRSTISVDGNRIVVTGTSDSSAYFGVGIAPSSAIVANHKVLIRARITEFPSNAVNISVSRGGSPSLVDYDGKRTITSAGTIDCICSFAASTAVYVNAGFSNDVDTTSQHFTMSDAQLFDLTLMFGAGNEPATVEEFEAMFSLPNYLYSAPKLLPVDMRGIETVGFNQWDAMKNPFEDKNMDGQSSGTTASTSGLIPVLPNVEYELSHTGLADIQGQYVRFYDALGQALGGMSDGVSHVHLYGSGNFQFTTIDGAWYCKLMMYRQSGISGAEVMAANPCLHLVWSGYRNGEYEEYWSAERAIDTSRFFPTGLKKVGDKADALYADHYDTMIGSVDLGTIDWQAGSTNVTDIWRMRSTNLFTLAKVPSTTTELASIKCASYQVQRAGQQWAYATESIALDVNGYLWIYDSRFNTQSSAAAFKAAMSGVVLYYELATPTTTEIDPPLNLSYKVSDFGTERIMVDETADAPQTAPVPMEVEYGINATDTVRRLPTQYISHESFQQFVAALQSAVGITVTETWDENDGRYEYTVTQTGE